MFLDLFCPVDYNSVSPVVLGASTVFFVEISGTCLRASVLGVKIHNY